MNKTIRKILTFLGFVVIAVSWVVEYLDDYGYIAYLFPQNFHILYTIVPILAMAFMFAENKVLNNVGYGLSALLGALGIVFISNEVYILFSAGAIVMLLASVLYVIDGLLAFFNYVKSDKKINGKGSITEVMEYYKLKQDGIISEDDFLTLKNKLLNVKDQKNTTLDDLKSWKKLADQNIISEEDFNIVKSKALNR